MSRDDTKRLSGVVCPLLRTFEALILNVVMAIDYND